MSQSSSGWYRILFIVLAVLYIFAGIMLVCNPAVFAPSMINLIGLFGIVYGIILIASYFMEANFKSIYTLISGIIVLLLGLLVVFNPFRSSIVMGAMCAVAFLAIGCFKIYQAFFVKDLGVSTWWSVLLLAACNIIVGLIMMFHLQNSAGLITILIGVNLLVNGVSDLMLGIMGF